MAIIIKNRLKTHFKDKNTKVMAFANFHLWATIWLDFGYEIPVHWNVSSFGSPRTGNINEIIWKFYDWCNFQTSIDTYQFSVIESSLLFDTR